MARPAPSATRAQAAEVVDDAVRWGMGDAVGGWLVANSAAVIGAAVILGLAGRHGRAAASANLPLTLIALLQVPLWLGYAGAPLYAATAKGRGVVRDFRARMVPSDIGLGLLVGLVCQFVLVPLVSWPVLRFTNHTSQDLSSVAKHLSDKATDPLGVVLLVLIVAIGAPIIEELFFRGLVLRSIEKRFTPLAAVLGSGFIFGATHFELLQLPALVAFGVVLGLLAWRTDRLGPCVVAHMAFNATAVASLLLARG